MATIQGDKLVAIPFDRLLDPVSGRVHVRYVDVTSEMYQTLAAYMIRLKPEDLADPARVRTLARAGHLGDAAFVERFGALVGGRSA